jgi:hypothetical protein
MQGGDKAPLAAKAEAKARRYQPLSQKWWMIGSRTARGA